MKQHWSVPPEWAGEAAFLVGCGPSLRTMDLRGLQGRRVIAINDAYKLVPWAEILYFCDALWWENNRVDVQENFQGRWIVTGQTSNIISGVRTLRLSGAEGLETDPGALRHGSNSGYQAINLAYHLGAARIALLGYDMRVDGNHLHWRARPTELRRAEGFQRTLQTVMLPKFHSLVKPLALAGVTVVNCTPGSALKVWAYRPLAQVLQEESVLA